MVARAGHGGPDPRDPLMRWARLPLAVQVAFVASGTLATALLVGTWAGPPLWPPAGLVVVALLVSPLRRWPALLGAMLAGALAFALLEGRPASLLGADLVTAAAGAGITWALLGVRRAPDLSCLRDVWAVLGGAVVAGPALGGLAGAAVGGGDWLKATMAMVTGVLVVAPVLLAVPSDGRRLLIADRPLEGAACLAAAAAAPLVAVAPSDLPLLAVAPIWAALRLGAFGTMAATALTTLMVTAVTVAGHGPFAEDALAAAQAFAAIVVAAGAVLAAMTAERRRAAERLRQAQRMEGIGRLAGAVVHEFGNLLTIIGGHGAHALEKSVRGEDVSGELRRMLEANDRAAVLTRRLLAVSRPRPERREPVSLNRVVEAMGRLLEGAVGEGVALEIALDPRAGCVICDPGQLEQVVLNLAVNARDAMPGGGALQIATSRAGADGVRLTVADTGAGMDEATRTRAFDPFFSTKEGGAGLGLATVYGVVEQCGGQVELRSAPGGGTTVRIDFPRSAAEPAAEDPPPPRPGAATVLVAEDEPSLRLLVRIALGEQGHTVLEAANGEQALAIAGGHDGPIDLLVTDIVMPRMSGPELARRLRERRPELRVLYMSGYPARELTPSAELDEENFIAKPFSPLELVRRVRERLDQPARPHPGGATATPPRRRP